MSEDLKKLEERVDALIQAVDRLKQENHALKSEKDGLSREHEELVEKTRMARGRIESMIDRLKALERSS